MLPCSVSGLVCIVVVPIVRNYDRLRCCLNVVVPIVRNYDRLRCCLNVVGLWQDQPGEFAVFSGLACIVVVPIDRKFDRLRRIKSFRTS